MANQHDNKGSFKPKASLLSMDVSSAKPGEEKSYHYTLAPSFIPDGPIECKSIYIYDFKFVLLEIWGHGGSIAERCISMDYVQGFDVKEWFKEIVRVPDEPLDEEEEEASENES